MMVPKSAELMVQIFYSYIFIFSFSKQSFNESLDFSNLMNYMNLIDSCQAHLPVQYALNTEFIRQK